MCPKSTIHLTLNAGIISLFETPCSEKLTPFAVEWFVNTCRFKNSSLLALLFFFTAPCIQKNTIMSHSCFAHTTRMISVQKCCPSTSKGRNDAVMYTGLATGAVCVVGTSVLRWPTPVVAAWPVGSSRSTTHIASGTTRSTPRSTLSPPRAVVTVSRPIRAHPVRTTAVGTIFHLLLFYIQWCASGIIFREVDRL